MSNVKGKKNSLSGDVEARIMAAAKDHFMLHGYENTSLDQIVRTARISKTSIYKLFGGKKELFIAVLKNLHEETQNNIPEVSNYCVATYQGLMSSLSELGVNYLHYLLDKNHLIGFRVTLSVSGAHQDIARLYLDSCRSSTRAVVAEILRSAHEKEVVSVHNPETSAAHFLGMVRGDLYIHALFDHSFMPHFEDLKEHALQATASFLEGICPR